MIGEMAAKARAHDFARESDDREPLAKRAADESEHDAVLPWTETIEWSRTGTELILRS